MNTFSRKGGGSLLAVFAVLLMPLLGIGTASAFSVGDHVQVLVPDLQEFPGAPALHQFTCRAITDHAVWLVQDTSYVNDKGGIWEDSIKIVWGTSDSTNLVDPSDFSVLTSAFEDSVWSQVTADCGVPTDLNGDGKVVVILASIPTKYNSSPSSQSPRGNMYFVDPDFDVIDGTPMEVFYINIHPYTTVAATMPAAVQLRRWNLANALADLSITSRQEEEEPWLVRGLAEVMQYKCFGFTQTSVGNHGIFEILKEFEKAASNELTSVTSGNQKIDYASSRGQQFLWFMYLTQREGAPLVPAVAKDTVNTGMLSIAKAIDPQASDSVAVQNLVVPIYFDWLVCNLHNDFRSDYDGGKYKYDFLEGTTQEDWAHAAMGAAFTLSFNSYPIAGAIPAPSYAMAAPIWASAYCRFEDYTQNWTTYFNGQYSDGRGANPSVNSKWQALLVKCDDTTEEFTSVETLSFDSLYNTTFELDSLSANTYLILTNNNPGGAAGMRYYISNDAVSPVVQTALHQNSLVSQFITTYCALAEADTTEGFDWIGPVFEATLGDSVLNIKMSSFYGDIWSGVFPAWYAGNYQLSFAGYDSSGHYLQSIKDVAVGFADADLSLEMNSVRLEVPKGGAPSGSMVTLAETGVLGLAVESSAPIAAVSGRMTGVLAGPVAIPQVTGTLSFSSSTNEAAIYRYTSDGWVKLDSWMQEGRIYASVSEGGIYALGEGIGVFSPEVPARLVLGGNAPNPFSSQTAINFGLPVAGNVRISVFDMSGRLVTTVANEEMAAANHTIVWDGTDTSGTPVGAGVYFCRLEAAGQVLTQKMLKVQ